MIACIPSWLNHCYTVQLIPSYLYLWPQCLKNVAMTFFVVAYGHFLLVIIWPVLLIIYWKPLLILFVRVTFGPRAAAKPLYTPVQPFTESPIPLPSHGGTACVVCQPRQEAEDGSERDVEAVAPNGRMTRQEALESPPDPRTSPEWILRGQFVTRKRERERRWRHGICCPPLLSRPKRKHRVIKLHYCSKTSAALEDLATHPSHVERGWRRSHPTPPPPPRGVLPIRTAVNHAGLSHRWRWRRSQYSTDESDANSIWNYLFQKHTKVRMNSGEPKSNLHIQINIWVITL